MDKYTLEDLVDIVESEGLGYAIQHYLDPTKIEEPVMRNLWEAAANILDIISNKLDEAELERERRTK